MRIGTLSNGLAIQKFDKQMQRAIVQKHIPQYIQIMLYDLNYPNPATLHVEGTLVGTSASNLATLMQQLKAIVRSKRVCWIDASDAYQGRLDFVRIIKLQGPTLDATHGFLTAKFVIDANILPPWGTTHGNPWKDTGIYYRDLNNVGREYAINPLMNHCNFTIDNTNKFFSWEFIVDNQNAFTDATSVQESSCDSLGSGTASPTNPIATNAPFSDASFDSLSIDNTNYKEGLGSLKGSKSSPSASTEYGLGYDFGSSGMDISSYDRLRMWYRCDHASLGYYQLVIRDINGHIRWWQFNLQAANTWMNIEVALGSYAGQSGTAPDLTKIRYIGADVQTGSSPPTSVNVWIDDIRLEIGYVNHCEDTSRWTQWYGSGTFSNDTSIFKEGNSSLKLSGSTNAGAVGFTYALPIAAWNFTSPTAYDFLLFWFRSDFGGNSSGTFQVYLEPPGGGSDFQWNYTLNANQWYRLVVPLRNPAATAGTVNLDNMGSIQFETIGATATTNIWLDEICLDVGRWTYLEFHLPDNVSQSQGENAIQVASWNGSAYNDQSSLDAFGNGAGGTPYSFLDGETANQLYSGWWFSWPPGTVGSTVSGPNGNGNLTYTQTYGCNERLAYAIKLPPATSDSASGNYPSNDLTGFQALNKVRLKIQVYYSNEDTTYAGN